MTIALLRLWGIVFGAAALTVAVAALVVPALGWPLDRTLPALGGLALIAAGAGRLFLWSRKKDG